MKKVLMIKAKIYTCLHRFGAYSVGPCNLLLAVSSAICSVNCEVDGPFLYHSCFMKVSEFCIHIYFFGGILDFLHIDCCLCFHFELRCTRLASLVRSQKHGDVHCEDVPGL